MAFKGFNYEVQHELQLDPDNVHDAFHGAIFVFFFQFIMIFIVVTIIMGDGFKIVLPNNVSVMGARFICAILMHL